MRIYIVRHGKAEPESPTGRDEDRQLVLRGVNQADYLADEIAKIDPAPRLVISSGVRRARQTAQRICARLNLPMWIDARLGLDAQASDALQAVLDRCPGGSALVVGHQPTVGDLAAILGHGLGGDQCLLRTGEAVILDVDDHEPIGSGRFVARIRLEDAHTLCTSSH